MVMFEWGFIDNGSTDSQKSLLFWKLLFKWFISSLVLDIFSPWPRNWGPSQPTVVYALRSWLIEVFSLYTSLHYINGWCPIVVTINSPMRVDAR